METASDLMYIADDKGYLSYVNSAMAKILEYTKEELVRMHVTDIMDKKTGEDHASKEQQLIADGEVFCEITWEAKAGRKIHGEVKITAIYDDTGKFIESHGIFREKMQA